MDYPVTHNAKPVLLTDISKPFKKKNVTHQEK